MQERDIVNADCDAELGFEVQTRVMIRRASHCTASFNLECPRMRRSMHPIHTGSLKHFNWVMNDSAVKETPFARSENQEDKIGIRKTRR